MLADELDYVIGVDAHCDEPGCGDGARGRRDRADSARHGPARLPGRRVRWCWSDAGKPRRQEGNESRPLGGQAPDQAKSGARPAPPHTRGPIIPKAHTRWPVT
jgi:hypothetical protein